MFSRQTDPNGFSDEELRIAAQAVRNSMLKSLDESVSERHTFSDAFLQRMQKLFRLDNKRTQRKRILQHAAVFLIGVFLAGALLLAFNPEVRADFSRWVRNLYEKSVFYQFFSDESSEESESPASLPDVEFTWLPGDYDVQVFFSSPQKRRIVLSGKNDSIMLEYWAADNLNFLEAFTEGYKHEQVEINGLIAEAITNPNLDDTKSTNAIVWINKNRTFCFNLSGTHPLEELIIIAEGIIEK